MAGPMPGTWTPVDTILNTSSFTLPGVAGVAAPPALAASKSAVRGVGVVVVAGVVDDDVGPHGAGR